MFDRGQFIEDTTLSVSVKNKGLNYGLGAIDGIRAFWNEEHKQLYVFRLEDHINRFHSSCDSLFIPVPYTKGEQFHLIRELLLLNEVTQDVYIRPICFKGERELRPRLSDPYNRLSIYVDFSEYEAKPSLKVCISSWTRIASNAIPPQTKSSAGYLNSGLAIQEAEINGYDEAVFLTADGHVSEGATENIFIVEGSTLITPPVADDIFPGITRSTVFEIAVKELGLSIVEQSFTRIELYEAEEVFFTGTAIGIKPVVEVDRRVIGSGQIGPVTRRIERLYEQMIRGNVAAYLNYCTAVY
ncbi:branched-chain amino acid transaminase [Halobacillus sp. A5]|uniref:branched-chain amino acid transaminase n=1 Tax=Halobacillus sp. A5 TaxID=2880263 RepID=UPI0020A6B5EF|nr:branched-chain amino acid transaminase [Halobacillus sp. A5]MCP3028920.1 branched-chain amino acid transaminase [Halobacillus sp. A5]